MDNNNYIAVRGDNCINCHFCKYFIACPVDSSGCIGCNACSIACPQEAIILKPRTSSLREIKFFLNGREYKIQGPISVFTALNKLGLAEQILESKNSSTSFLCQTGGCGVCSVVINGQLVRTCNLPLEEGMDIRTEPSLLKDYVPRRIISVKRPAPHYHPSLFTHGCNFRCPLCHNWDLTFSSIGETSTPEEAVKKLNVDNSQDYWIGISGGEPTLNQDWLLQTIRLLREDNPVIRIQLDTNASLLNSEYIDRLVYYGISDISPDLKAYNLETFMYVTGIKDPDLADTYLKNSWDSVRYINERYRDRIFMSVSVACHPRTHSRQELESIGQSLFQIDPNLTINLIEYQPAFRLRDWPKVSEKAMEQACQILTEQGLERVFIQGGPSIPKPFHPLDMALGSEIF